MKYEDYEYLITHSEIFLDSENNRVCFAPQKGAEKTITALIKKHNLNNLTREKFLEIHKEHLPALQTKQKLRDKKTSNFRNLSPENIAALPLEEKIGYLEALFCPTQTQEELKNICFENKDKLQALLYHIELPKSFWKKEEQEADRFVALVSNNSRITENMRNWQNLGLDEKKATIFETAKIINYVYKTRLEIGFYTSKEYRKKNNLNEKTPVFGAYHENGKMFFNLDRLEHSDNYMGVSVLFHEFTHKRQHEKDFKDPMARKLLACRLVYKASGYELRNTNPLSPEYGDLYSLMPAEVHAYAMQEYVENEIAARTGIEKKGAEETQTAKQVHDKSFAMAKTSRYRSI